MLPSAVAESAAVPGAALRAALAAPLRLPALAAAAGPAFEAAAIEAVQETGSTNADLLAQARAAAPASPRLRAALVQRAGRGRLGRRWHAAPGAALLFSVAVPLGPDAPPPAAALAAGVALAETLAAQLGVEAKLKWPNDLLLEGRKAGGVLAELAVDRGGARTLVVGAGINLWLDEAARASIGQPAAALAERIALDVLATQREALIGVAAAALVAAIRDCAARGFVPFQARYMQRFALLGQAVDLVEHGARAAGGRVLGVDGDGRLLLERDGRITAVASGEVSVRLGTGERALGLAAGGVQ